MLVTFDRCYSGHLVAVDIVCRGNAKLSSGLPKPFMVVGDRRATRSKSDYRHRYPGVILTIFKDAKYQGQRDYP